MREFQLMIGKFAIFVIAFAADLEHFTVRTPLAFILAVMCVAMRPRATPAPAHEAIQRLTQAERAILTFLASHSTPLKADAALIGRATGYPARDALGVLYNLFRDGFVMYRENSIMIWMITKEGKDVLAADAHERSRPP